VLFSAVTETVIWWKIFIKVQNMKFKENFGLGISLFCKDRQKDRRMDGQM